MPEPPTWATHNPKFPAMATPTLQKAERTVEEWRTLASRARTEVSKMFERLGIATSAVRKAAPTEPHLRVESQALKIWPRVSVQREKFQVRLRMAEATAFSALEDPAYIPVLFHKRRGEPWMAVVKGEDFIQMFRLADAMAKILNDSRPNQPVATNAISAEGGNDLGYDYR